MIDLIQLAGSLGVGAMLGLVIFFMYRYDRRTGQNQMREDRKYMEDRLSSIISADVESRKENTKVVTELVVLLSRLNGKSSR